MLRKFAILGMPRCGSTFLCTALDSNPALVVHGELFLPDRIGPFRGTLRQGAKDHPALQDLARRDAQPVAFLEQVLNHDQNISAAGFKIFYSQNREVLEYIADAEDYAKIFVTRDNLLAVYSSDKIARETGQWHVRTTHQHELVQVKIEFQVAAFQAFIDRQHELIAVGASLRKRSRGPVLEISYADIANHDAFPRVFEFLQIPGERTFEAKQVKQNPEHILDRFSNPENVVAYLENIDRSDWVQET